MKFDKAITGMDKSGSFRVYMAVTTEMVEKAHELHGTSPLATHLLGRALTGTGLMGLMLREPGFKVTLQFKGDGPAQQVLCTAGSDGSVKGFIANPLVDLPAREDGSPDVGGALGIGVLTCIRDAGMKEPYVGKIDFVTGEIADDMTAYFWISEQQQTSVSLGVKLDENAEVKAAGGMIIQMLPDATEECISALEKWLPEMPKISELADKVSQDADGRSMESIMEEYLRAAFLGMPEEFQIMPLDTLDIGWKCDCSEERLEQVVKSLGAKEISDMIEQDGQAELTCQFCGKSYHFDKEHLERLKLECLKERIAHQDHNN
ncbi:MAG: Hsp33 family molecular chaperone HslO [Anaerovoracaceae bacterium]|nr:Hsp33 family molecular chaperone HslO [Bacillota bacterium]MDD7733529.1 Hsp33 family molecular chaperone HslO [Bacillota bacterium]MDY5906600.1 Hsp33 family molecular chaperone HslO [Anaerovoracaceae bacterium]